MPPKDPKSEFIQAQKELSVWIKQVNGKTKERCDWASTWGAPDIRSTLMDNFRDLIDAADQVQAGLDRRNIAAKVTGNYTTLLDETRRDTERFLNFRSTVHIANNVGYGDIPVQRVEEFAGSVTVPSLAELAAARLPSQSALEGVHLSAQPYQPAQSQGATRGRS
ncbi:hypothetical protein ACFW9I_33985 [[Kitasatospora] papulosa]|uniref:hypothetical protein n=1 Tax=[Kitasatospora] papulosa TaxID=1464011 RepID=UPI003689D289